MNQDRLMKCFEETLNIVRKENIKKFNLKTVKNLIIHFNNIDGENKELVYDELYNYLIFIRDIRYIGSDRESKQKSNELYMTFIDPLIQFYIPLGFSANFSWAVLIFVFIFSLPILIILNCSIYWYIFLCALLFLIRLWSWLKKRRHKVYGPLF